MTSPFSSENSGIVAADGRVVRSRLRKQRSENGYQKMREVSVHVAGYRIALADSGNEGAADASAAGRGLLPPDRFQVHADRRKNRHVQNSKQILRNFFLRIELNGHAAETQVEDAGAFRSLLAENCISVCAGHRDAIGFALDRKYARRRGQDLRSGWNRLKGRPPITMVFFIRRTFGLNRNRRREWSRRLGGNRRSCRRFDGRPRFDAVGSVDCFFVVVVLLAVKALVSNANKLIRLLGIFREDSNAMVHAHGNFQLEGTEHL